MRLVFAGTPDIAIPSLRAIAAREDWTIEAVLSQPDRPAGRGREPRPSPVKEAALELGLDVHTPERLKDIRPWLTELAPDAIAVVAYGHIFRRWLLELPPLGCVNLHFSLLPRHRGVAPVQWAIWEGDARSGVATMKMDRGVDTGDILHLEPVTIGETETAGELLHRLAAVGGPLLARTLDELQRGVLEATPQPTDGVSYARRLEKEDGRVMWTQSAVEIDRQVRALSPWPGAFTTWREQPLKLHEVRPGAARELAPGQLELEDHRVFVGTGDGALELLVVQAQGKARTDAAAWARGARPEAGDRLGASS